MIRDLMFQGAVWGFSYLLIQMIAPYLVGGRGIDKKTIVKKVPKKVPTSYSNLC